MTVREVIEGLYETWLRRQITHVPGHIAVIQDGNRRYASIYRKNTAFGHRAGARTTELMLDWCQELGIRHITLYSFSTENFKRDQAELTELFGLFREMFERVVTDERVHRHKIRIQIVGDRTLLPDDLRAVIDRAEERTAANDQFFVNVALAYGGRNEIVHATRALLAEVRAGSIDPAAIGTADIERHLHGGLNLPPVDLILRTGNEKRTSNFLPWLANGNESAVYFSAPFWPMFRKIDLLRGIRVYDQRIKMAAGHLPNRRLRN
ncbi:MAG: di-trans,poly-cis-decaprenylcistransferase [Methanomicrobiales archaeon]|nr:di-trans,poly-cis-decaprenylcistransferase [Methanomicrobiales archaeon]